VTTTPSVGERADLQSPPVSGRRARALRPSAPVFGTTAAVLALILVKLVATIGTSSRYGFHRDELYYLDCARHLALGYVDFPPVAPLLARLDTTLLLGTSLVGLRLMTALAGAAIMLVTAWMTRNLGGGPFAQFLAVLAVLTAPMFLGANGVFETVTFDQLTWSVVLLLVVHLLRTDNLRLWPAVGVAAGVGLETKYTILGLVAGLAIGFLLTSQRRQLRTPWPWLAALIALALLAPNLIWQIQHGWPSLSYVTTHHGRIAQDTSRVSFLAEQLILVGPLALPLAGMGVYFLFTRLRYRALGWAFIVTELFFLVAGGKSYYAGPIYTLLFAAGAVQAAVVLRGRLTRAGMAAALVLSGAVLLPLSLPVLPAKAMVQSNVWKVRTDYADEVGWPEMVAQVARVYRGLPPSERASTAILTSNYGEAGAIDLFGPARGLPRALSGHLTYYYWKPAHVDARTLIAIGIPRSMLAPLYRDIRLATYIRNDLDMRNEEWGTPIYLCRHVTGLTLDRAWPAQRHYD
jgi:hypothetical protein